MFRKSSNNPFIQGGYLNSAYSTTLGGPETVGQRYPGLLGQTVVAGNADALKMSDTAIATLYEGVYQLVKFTSAVTRGELVVWDTLANNGLNDFEVTHTVAATSDFRAGVVLRTDASATGSYGWIQVAGLANMLYGATATATLGLGIIQASALDTPLLTVATVSTVADATAWTSTFTKAFIGLAYETPSATNVRRVLMNLGSFYPNIGN